MKQTIALFAFLITGSLSAASSSPPPFSLTAVLFETTDGTILKALNGFPPGILITTLGPFQLKAKLSGSLPQSLNCIFDGKTQVHGVPTSGGFLCPVPAQDAGNGSHTLGIAAQGLTVTQYYSLSNQPPVPVENAAIPCLNASCVQSAINGAASGGVGAPTIIDFGGSQITDCGMISLDAVNPYVTITNLSLTGVKSDCTIGNTIPRATTNNVVLDHITVNQGTHSKTLASCGAGAGIASFVLYGINNTIQNSTINGGTASGVFLGGSNNIVKDSTFNGVNTYNGLTMTSCSGVMVAGFHELVAFNSFNTCNGTCIHIAPGAYAAPHISPTLLANDSIWGNKIINAINQSFVGTLYSGDAGAIYAGWCKGNNTNIQWNRIQGLNPNNYGSPICGGFTCAAALYFDNNTSYFNSQNNFVDVNPGYPALKINPQTYQSNPNGALTSGNRTSTNNSWTGNAAVVASMKVINKAGQTVAATSPDASCPFTCNNTPNANSTPPFASGVGAESTLPPPVFLSTSLTTH